MYMNNYIHIDELKEIVSFLLSKDEESLHLLKLSKGFLLTPYLINNNFHVYELHYMEVFVEFSNKEEVTSFSKQACFSEKFKELFHPKICGSRQNKEFILNQLDTYINNFKNFDYKQEFGITNLTGDIFFEIV